MEPVRVLFVDDEPGIRLTMPQILRQQGLRVRAVGTVSHALAEITSAQFDVLISDLNIGQPGDGFTVVSAMRRTQPKCVTIILTGYPDCFGGNPKPSRWVPDQTSPDSNSANSPIPT